MGEPVVRMSPCFIRALDNDGLHPVDYTADSLADAARYEPDDGVYTVTNTYNTDRVLQFDAHLDRLEDSARRAGIALHLDRLRLRHALRQMIHESGFGSVRFRLSVPHDANQIIISMEPFKGVPEHLRTDGVCVITVPDSARHDAATKSTEWMHRRRQIADSLPEGVYDAILMDADGYMMEGLGANFYAIVDGELRTAAGGVLAGIAQGILFRVAPDVLPVQRHAVHRDDVPRLAEAFITSSSRGIIPVVEIDGHVLGNGAPGPKTRQLWDSYQRWVDDHLEPL